MKTMNLIIKHNLNKIFKRKQTWYSIIFVMFGYILFKGWNWFMDNPAALGLIIIFFWIYFCALIAEMERDGVELETY